MNESEKRNFILQFNDAIDEIKSTIYQIESSHINVQWKGADFDSFNSRFYDSIRPNLQQAIRVLEEMNQIL